MKCPFRIKTVKTITKKSQVDKEEIIQEFEDCYGASCAAAYIVEYNGVPKAEGCKRVM